MKPTEGQWFMVDRTTIDIRRFMAKRKDPAQEKARLLILDAIKEADANPDKYPIKFETYVPEKTWEAQSIEKLIQLANDLGDNMADWAEEALEWAQKLANGKTWEELCNKADTSKCYRLIFWKNGLVRMVGGAECNTNTIPSTDIFENDFLPETIILNSVPKVVRKKVA